MNRPLCVRQGPQKFILRSQRFEDAQVGGLYRGIHLFPFSDFLFFFKSSCFKSVVSLFFLFHPAQTLVLSVSSSMKELKSVSSQLWLAMHCCTTSSWPGSSAACSMVLVWKRGTETQDDCEEEDPKQVLSQKTENTSWLYLVRNPARLKPSYTMFISAPCLTALFFLFFTALESLLNVKNCQCNNNSKSVSHEGKQ